MMIQVVFLLPKWTKIQCTDSVFQPNQNTSDFFHRTRINNPKVCMELQETPSSQSYLKKEKQS